MCHLQVSVLLHSGVFRIRERSFFSPEVANIENRDDSVEIGTSEINEDDEENTTQKARAKAFDTRLKGQRSTWEYCARHFFSPSRPGV